MQCKFVEEMSVLHYSMLAGRATRKPCLPSFSFPQNCLSAIRIDEVGHSPLAFWTVNYFRFQIGNVAIDIYPFRAS